MALGAHPAASLRQRTGEAVEQKYAIARWAASVIRPEENILLDAVPPWVHWPTSCAAVLINCL